MTALGRVLLIGSTGPLGRLVVQQAAARGVRVRAFARNPAALNDLGVADVAKGDVNDVGTIEAALSEVDTVISVLGSKPGKKSAHLLADGTTNILTAMNNAGARRLICVTGMGAGSSRGHGPFWYDKIVRPTILRAVYADKENQEALIEASGLEWTIVRPAVLTNKPTGKPVIARASLAPREKMGSVSRDDVAVFLLNEASNPEHVRQVVHLYT